MQLTGGQNRQKTKLLPILVDSSRGWSGLGFEEGAAHLAEMADALVDVLGPHLEIAGQAIHAEERRGAAVDELFGHSHLIGGEGAAARFAQVAHTFTSFARMIRQPWAGITRL